MKGRYAPNIRTNTPPQLSIERDESYRWPTTIPATTLKMLYYQSAYVKIKRRKRTRYSIVIIRSTSYGFTMSKPCKRCHYEQIFNTSMNNLSSTRKCWDCHRNVPHGTVKSLSSVPNAIVPLSKSMLPNWNKKRK